MLVAGSTAYDVIARVDELPDPDTARRAETITDQPGGCGANVARGLARLGNTPTLLSAVGRDFGEKGVREALAGEGVELEHVLVADDVDTARAILTSEVGGRQTILYREGATPRMRELEPVDAELAHFAPGELTAYPELMQAVDRVVFDPGQELFYRPIEHTLDCLPHVDVLVCNEHEAERIDAATDGIDDLARQREAVIVTHASGQRIHTGDETTSLPHVDADAVDPTGAGDAHCAGLVHGLAQGWPLEKASRFGSAVAACVVEQLGAQAGLPTLEEAQARLEER